MRRYLALVLVVAMALLGVPSVTFAGTGSPVIAGQVSGAARTTGGSPIANATVRLRNSGTGQIAGTTTTGAGGDYSFKTAQAGNYVVELLNSTGAVIATSVPVSLSRSESVNGVALTPASGAAGIGAVPEYGAGSFFKSKAGILLLAGAATGLVAGVIVSSTDKSPSR